MGRWIFAVLGAAGLAGCSTITEGPSQGLLVATDPPGARCEIRRRGDIIATIEQTPGTAVVHKSPFDITIDCARPGYFPGAAVVDSRMDNMTYGNLLIGGGIGLIVDASTGAWNQYPRTVRIRMQPHGGGSVAGAGGPDITTLLAAVDRRADAAVVAAQRACAQRVNENCVAQIEIIESRRNVEREALFSQQRVRNPSAATPVF